MSDTTNSLDIRTIFQTIFNHLKLILGIVAISMIAGVLFYFISPEKYKHKTVVILRNPLEADRNQIFNQPENYYQNIRNFADEDHIDEIMAITATTDFYWAVMTDANLKDIYGENAEKYLRKNLEVTRNSNRGIEFTFISADKNLGAQVVNYARNYVEKKYADYFKSINLKKIEQLAYQATEINNQLQKLSDSIIAVKSEYQLSSLLLPTRGENNPNTTTSVDITKAKGLELLQTLTTQKDKLVNDLALNQSLSNQYEVSVQDDLRASYFHVIQDGNPDKFDMYPNAVYLFLSIFLCSLLLGVIIALLKK